MHRLCLCLGIFSLTVAYENIALNKSAYQQYLYAGFDDSVKRAGNAVDGKKSNLGWKGGQCTLSENYKRTATWWVDLTNILSIHHITIYYRTENAPWGPSNGFTPRFLGFSVHVSNTTDRLKGFECFKDSTFTLSTIPSVFNTTCPVHGQYVIYYNERLQGATYPSDYSDYAFSELCELEVLGCPTTGYYGPDCSFPCPHSNCRFCHIETGTCQGCKPGYQGHQCESECPDGKYGEGCDDDCGYCTNFTQCHHVNGSCLTGCLPGYKGDKCKQVCDVGTYGGQCKETCGFCLDHTMCFHTNGTCLTGCAAGYQGDLCKTRCPDGSFGLGCINKCNSTCRGCNKTNGLCEFGCFPGWKGNYCHQECNNGMFGDNCTEKCGNCFKFEQCHHVNGTCINGCEKGFQGLNCTVECDDTHFGFNCEETCNETCKGCNKTTGVCENGCHPGWKGSYCQKECDVRMFGENCAKECGNCLRYEQCHHVNGTCMDGCDRGFQGSNCTEACDDYHFGYNCEEMCNATCYSCNKTTGVCEYGCRPGYTGMYCHEDCPEGSFGENCSSECGHCLNGVTCDHINGSCLSGCDSGYQAPFCTKECTKGRYGPGCIEYCGNCSDISYCHHENGTCFTGCNPGYQGPLCKEDCKAGTFGQDCAYKCNKTCVGCDKVNGVCYGCVSNWKGEYCQEAIIGGPPKTNDALPIIGALVGTLIGAVLILVAVIVYRRKRQGKQNREKYAPSSEENKEEYAFDNPYSSPEKHSRKKADKKLKNNTQEELLTSNMDEDHQTNGEISNEEDNVYMNETPSQDIPVNEIESAIAEKRAKGNELFKKEYAALPSGEIRKCDVGKMPENISKNRFKTTFPYDHSRIRLAVTDEETSDYINANYIDGPNRPKEYIAAQGPKQNTLGDFWKMICQEDVSSIVMLTNLKEAGKAFFRIGDIATRSANVSKTKCTQYWPNLNETLMFGQVSITLIDEKDYAFFIERKLSVSIGTLKKSRMVTQYHYTAWPDHGTPEPMNLLDFHHHVISTASNKKAPTVVHCSAGVGRTGTYIALDALYQEGKKTGKVNVAEFVKKMRDNRVSMVQTYEQYITIFLALNEIFKAPIKLYNTTEFCAKTEKTMKDNPANRNPLRREFQLLLKIRPNYTEADYKMAKQNYVGKATDKALPLDKYSLHLSSMVSKRGSYINAICVPSHTKARRFIVTQYPSPEDAVDFLRLLNDHESDTVICLDPVHSVESIQSWLPPLSSSKTVAPFTIHCQPNPQSGVTGQVLHIIQDNEDDAHSVLVVEPKCRIIPNESPIDTSELLGLVSCALSSETDKAVTVVSSDGASLCGVFIAVHNAIEQLNMDGGVDVFTAVRQLQIRRPELCGSFEEYDMINRAVYDHIQNASENIYANQ